MIACKNVHTFFINLDVNFYDQYISLKITMNLKERFLFRILCKVYAILNKNVFHTLSAT